MEEGLLNNIVRSTAAVVFLGTPHRGSPELAAFGEWARSTISAFGMETSATILGALGLKTTDLERAQEAFSGLWRKYDFRVKTFQEGLGLSGLNLGVLGNKVVPDYSSLLGDEREHAETVHANHMDMCRFAGAEDPNYRKVAGELRSIYQAIVELNTQVPPQAGPSQCGVPSLHASPLAKASGLPPETERACLQSLWFPSMHNRLLTLEKPTEQTTLWLFEHTSYQDWFHDRNQDQYSGLLWLKGKPGAGKSTLMKEAFRRAAMGEEQSGYCTASFFYNAKGDSLESSTLGVFRSLLHQIVPKLPGQLQRFSEFWRERNSQWQAQGAEDVFQWHKDDLVSFFELIFIYRSSLSQKRTLIFIDALDECDTDEVRRQAYFWRRLTKKACGKLGVCISSRHFPSVTINDCPEIVVEDYNSIDIARYVEQRFSLTIAASEPQWELLRDEILAKSAGVFLWVVLVVDGVLRGWDDGKGLRLLLKQVDTVPQLLEGLFSDMVSSVSAEKRHLTLQLFRWAVLAAKPLRLHEWHHVLAFIREAPPRSLREWRGSDHFTETDDQLERQIRSISMGLVEVRGRVDEAPGDHHGHEVASACAGAGSFSLEHGETRVVQVIHESVREFFLREGFSLLTQRPRLNSACIGAAHLSILATCIDYIEIKELDALIEARTRADRHEQHPQKLGTGKHSARSGSTSDSPPLSRPASFGARHQSGIGFPRRRLRPTDVLERLKRSPEPDPLLETSRWIDTNLTAISALASDPMLLAGPSSPASGFSATGQSQVLEDYPALLSYATSELFGHAGLAEEEGADPHGVVKRLMDGIAWSRFVALREDLPLNTQLSRHVADLGLSSWTRYIRVRSVFLGFHDRRAHGDGRLNESHGSPDPIEPQLSKDQGTRRGHRRPMPSCFECKRRRTKVRRNKKNLERLLKLIKRRPQCDNTHPTCESKKNPLHVRRPL